MKSGELVTPFFAALFETPKISNSGAGIATLDSIRVTTRVLKEKVGFFQANKGPLNRQEGSLIFLSKYSPVRKAETTNSRYVQPRPREKKPVCLYATTEALIG